MSQNENQEKELTKLEKYLRKQKGFDFVDELMRATKIALEERIKQQALYKQESITAKNNDQELADTKRKARDLAAPYNDSIRMNDRISRFISLLIGEM